MTFTGLDGIEHRYFDDPYNVTRTNERAVEVPVALDWISRHHGRGLEVGNVLRHYVPASWLCVDAYETGPGVTNIDVLEYDPPDRFDWIVSISTVEHIGWDYPPIDPGRALDAIDHMRRLLVSGGELLVTFPTGHHPGLDEAVLSGELAPLSSIFLYRTDDAVERSPGTWEAHPFTPTRYRAEAWSAGGVWIGVLGPR